VPRLRMAEAIFSLTPPYIIIMAWYLIKNRDNFTYTITVQCENELDPSKIFSIFKNEFMLTAVIMNYVVVLTVAHVSRFGSSTILSVWKG
jgi:hypothetical protein